MIPASGRKKLYHKRVSPMVRKGGRSSDIHSKTMNAKNTISPPPVAAKAVIFLFFHAAHAPITHRSSDMMAKKIK